MVLLDSVFNLSGWIAPSSQRIPALDALASTDTNRDGISMKTDASVRFRGQTRNSRPLLETIWRNGAGVVATSPACNSGFRHRVEALLKCCDLFVPLGPLRIGPFSRCGRTLPGIKHSGLTEKPCDSAGR